MQGALNHFIEQAAVLDALQAQPVGNVFIDGFREGVGFLEHHADPSPQVGHIHRLVIDILAVELDAALHTATVDEIVHPVETAKQGGFAATARTDKGGDTLAGYGHINTLKGLLLAVIQVQVLDLE